MNKKAQHINHSLTNNWGNIEIKGNQDIQIFIVSSSHPSILFQKMVVVKRSIVFVLFKNVWHLRFSKEKIYKHIKLYWVVQKSWCA